MIGIGIYIGRRGGGVAKVWTPLFKAAMADLDSGTNKIYDINIVGDSIAEGAVAGGCDSTIGWNGSFAGILREALATKYNDVGKGLVYVDLFYDDRLWTFTGTWTLINNGFAARAYYSNAAVPEASVQVDGTEIYFHSASKPYVYIQIDDGVPFKFNTAKSAYLRSLVASGLTDTTHTVKIKHNYDDKPASFSIVNGVTGSRNNKGFRVNICARSGSVLQAHARSESRSALESLSPVLTIIASGTNEIIGAYNVNDYKTWLQDIVDSAKKSGDVILMATHVTNERTKAFQDNYLAKMQEVAEENDCLLIDIYSDWNLNGEALGYVCADHRHPNAAGHAYIANKLLEALGLD